MSPDLQKVQQRCEALLNSVSTVHVASVNSQGQPLASYTPFVRCGHYFYIYISDLAEHSENLKRCSKVSLLFVQDESAAKNIFARVRLGVQGDAEVVDLTTREAIETLDDMERELGKTVELLRTLSDFNLFRITVSQARFVEGFGKAYQWSLSDNTFEPVIGDKLKTKA